MLWTFFFILLLNLKVFWYNLSVHWSLAGCLQFELGMIQHNGHIYLANSGQTLYSSNWIYYGQQWWWYDKNTATQCLSESCNNCKLRCCLSPVIDIYFFLQETKSSEASQPLWVVLVHSFCIGKFWGSLGHWHRAGGGAGVQKYNYTTTSM